MRKFDAYNFQKSPNLVTLTETFLFPLYVHYNLYFKVANPGLFLVLFSFYLKTIFTEKNSRLQRDSNLYRPNCDHADYLTITTALQSI